MIGPSQCPKCNSENIYPQGNLWTCPECFHEWTDGNETEGTIEDSGPKIFRDANGNELKDGDSVSVIKDLKIKGSGGSVVKVGTKVRNIRLLTDAEDGHDIACRIEGVGAINLKSEFVKKV